MKRKPTKKAAFKAKPNELKALAAMRDDEIDLRDAPEVFDWSGAQRGRFYRPIKQQLTLRVDADVLAWFKSRAKGGGYQTQINKALREYVVQHARKRV